MLRGVSRLLQSIGFLPPLRAAGGSKCQCALAAVFALGGGGSCRVDRYDVRVMRYEVEVGALGWVSTAFVV